MRDGLCGQKMVGRRAYTLIEMVVVTAILALMALLIVPNMVAEQHARALRDTEAAILRLPEEAKDQAIRQKAPMVLHFDNNTLILERDTDDQDNSAGNTNSPLSRVPTTGNNSNNSNNTSTDIPQVVKQISLGTDIQVESAQKDSDKVDASSWRWVVWPDGSTDVGGLTFLIDGNRKSLYLPAGESPRWVDGDLPDPTQDRWQAGDVEQRVSQ